MRVRALSIAIAMCAAGVAPRGELRAQELATDTVGSCWTYQTPDARFRAEVVARGLTVPVSIAFLPDGRALVAERPVGRISFVELRTGALTPIEGVPAVVGEVDGGLLEVVAHPDFSRNGLIYFAYTEHTDSGNATVVERARLDGRRMVDRVRMLAVHPYIDNVNQFGARLVLDHGYLYIAIGDREIPALAQDLSSDAGKIVRLRDDGSVPADNPFVKVAGARPEIWSLGHRNPHGLAVDPRTGALWEHEHGPRGGDEINIIRAGRNYGWPVITYGIEYSGEPVGNGLTHQEGMEQPVYFYVPSIAPSGMAFYSGADFPRWRGNIFLGSLSYRHLNRVVLRGNRVVHEERLLSDRGWRIREVRQGPDGFLYLGIESGLLVRLRPDTAKSQASAPCASGIGASDPWAVAPGARLPGGRLTAVYDADARRVILLDDASADTTWEWDRHSWIAVPGITPPARAGQSIATDPSGGLLLFGGIGQDGTPLSESWHYATRRWSKVAAAGPPARALSSMAYDLDHHRTLLWGGTPCTDSRVWSWDGKEWAAIDSAGPPPRKDATMVYDFSTRSIVIAGGQDCAGRAQRESWRWDGTRWARLSSLPAIGSTCLVYSATRNRILLFALDSLKTGMAWQLNGSRWEAAAPRPPALRNATCAVDAAGLRIVLAGRAPAGAEPETYLLPR